MVREIKENERNELLNYHLSIQSSVNPVFSRHIAY